MASLAGMLQARGHRVTGSDENVYPPMSTQLAELGIEVLTGYAASNADIGADVTVVGNAISRGNAQAAGQVSLNSRRKLPPSTLSMTRSGRPRLASSVASVSKRRGVLRSGTNV